MPPAILTVTKRQTFVLVLALSVSGCARHASNAGAAATAPAAAAAAPAPAAPAAVVGCLPTHDGYLRVRVGGARDLEINWHDADLQCEGGPRPDQHGMRLAFAGPAQPDGHRLRFVFGIPGVRDATSSHGVPANVTIIFEGESKVYSTRGEDKCTIDELTQAPIAVASAKHALRVSGRGFCVGRATAINGRDGLLLSRFDFAGLMIDD